MFQAELVPDDDIDGPGDAVGGSVVDQRVDEFKESPSSSLKRLQKENFEKINENEEFYPANNGKLNALFQLTSIRLPVLETSNISVIISQQKNRPSVNYHKFLRLLRRCVAI